MTPGPDEKTGAPYR